MLESELEAFAKGVRKDLFNHSQMMLELKKNICSLQQQMNKHAKILNEIIKVKE